MLETQAADWLCRLCKGKDGKQFQNFSWRSSCKMCRVAKGKCFGGKVTTYAQGKPAVSLAERQVQRQQLEAKHAKAIKKKDEKLAEVG